MVTVVIIFSLAWVNTDLWQVGKKQQPENSYPIQAVDYLRRNSCPGNLFNAYRHGGYLIWKLPNHKVYIDGRMPVWRDERGKKYLVRYTEIHHNNLIREQEFKEHNIRCVLVDVILKNKDLIKALTKEGWKSVVNANGSVLLIK